MGLFDNSSSSANPKANSDGLSLRQFLLSVLIIAYFAIAIVQVSPGESVPKSAFEACSDPAAEFVRPIVSMFGLRQRWNLFAPDIRKMNFYPTALITFDDGSQKLYELPRVNLLPLEQRFLRHRIMRFVSDCWAQPQYRHYFPFGARFLSRAHSYSLNQPSMIEFYFNYCDIPPFSTYVTQGHLGKNFRWSAPEFAYRVRGVRND